MLLQAEQMYKMTSISLKMVEVVILNENGCHFMLAQIVTTVIFSHLEISHVLKGTTPEIQHRK